MSRTQSGITIVFPPHCSHILQPLDLSCFNVLKKGIYKAFCDAISASEVIECSDVPPLIKPAWQNAFAPENIKGAFRAAGISPLIGLSAVSKDKLSPRYRLLRLQQAISLP